jgi:hypothetical protein
MIYKRRSPNAGRVIVTFEIPGTIWAERINRLCKKSFDVKHERGL